MTTFWQREKHRILVALIIAMVVAVLLAIVWSQHGEIEWLKEDLEGCQKRVSS